MDEEAKKFSAVPRERDTRVIQSQISRIGEYDILYEYWHWEGLYGESVIFAEADVTELDDAQLTEMVVALPICESKSASGTTLKRSEGFVFVNFNFGAERDDDDEGDD